MSFRSIATGLIAISVTSALLYAGCGGGDSSPTRPTEPTPPTPTPPPPPAPTVSRIEVRPNMVSLEVGKTQQLVATAKASDGAVVSGVNFTWSSSNTAVVTISAGGLATAVSVGTATIRATGNGIVSEPSTITVTQAPVGRVTISPSATQEIMVGEMVTFTATARTAGGAVRDDVSFTWTSSDTTVVTVTSAGVATAVGAGMASVRATADGIASSPVTVNVAEPPPPAPVIATVTVSPSEASIEEGATQQFEAMAKTSDGEAVPDVMFTWESSDEMVATIDENGLATGVGAGDAMIKATADNVSGTAMLTVTEPPPPEPVVSTVTVSPGEATIETGQTQSFEAMALTADGVEIKDVMITWASTDEMVATVDMNGLATGVGTGQAMITATADKVSGTAVLTVMEPPPQPPPMVSTVTVSPSEASIEEGQTQQFEAMAKTSDGEAVPDVMFTWESSDEMVATIDENGLATGVGAGDAMIKATADNVSGTAMLTVTEPPPPEPVVSTVTLSTEAMMITVGGMFQFTAIATTADGMVIDDVEFTWMSDDTAVATVNETGLVTAVAAGTAMITATGNGVTSMPATVTVEETAPVVASVEIVDAMPLRLEVGDTHQLMAVARTSDGTMVGGVAFVWSSDDKGVATVDSTGLVSAIGAGMADITAMTEEATSEPVTVTVAEPPPEVDRVEVTPSAASIEEGDTRRFTARAYDSDNDRITGKNFTWTSSNTSVATISPSSGTATTATGVNTGSTTIRATVDGVSGTATLRVTEPPPVVSRVDVSPSSASIEEGNTRRFTATARESDGTVISGKTFTWTSTNTSVATVNPSTGTATTATGVSAGSSTIRATVDGVTGTATLRVTEPPPVVSRVDVSPSSASIEEGETQRFTATARESDGTAIPGKTFTWTSSNTSVATVSPSSGTATTATAVDSGSTTIKASVDGKSGTAMLTVTEPPPPPMLRSRTATISGTSNYPNTAGSVTFEEVAGGKLKLTITGKNNGGGVSVYLFLYTSSSISWRTGNAVPTGARNFGNVTRGSSHSHTFTPSAGETIDSYSHVILHCAAVNMPLGSGSF